MNSTIVLDSLPDEGKPFTLVIKYANREERDSKNVEAKKIVEFLRMCMSAPVYYEVLAEMNRLDIEHKKVLAMTKAKREEQI